MLKTTTLKMMLMLVLATTVSFMATIPQSAAEEVTVLRARVDIKPDTLVLEGFRMRIACFIELPEGYRPINIDIASIRLNRTLSPTRPVAIGDYDNDGIPELMVTFNRAELVRYVLANANLTQPLRLIITTLSVTGVLHDGTPFRGIDALRIILPRHTGM